MYLLGIDIGTSGTRAVLFDPAGQAVAAATAAYPLSQPRAGWAEQDPEDWWEATVRTVREVITTGNVPAAAIRGIGLSGQMHGLVLLDAAGRSLRPAIIWCDQRTAAACEELTETVGRERLLAETANPAVTGFTAAKLLWVRKHEPDIYARAAKILLPKDYIRFRLTGEFATEVSDASGMQLLNIRERNWSREVLDRLEIDPARLGRVYESPEITGGVSRAAAALTGLAAGTPVAGGGGDQACGAVGTGVVRPGVVSSVIGTSGVVFAATDKVTVDPCGRVHTFCHAAPGTWHVMGVTQGAGLSLQWFRDNLGESERAAAAHRGVNPYELLTEAADRAQPGCDGLLYLPYLMGERTPHLDAYARGVFFGLSARHRKHDLVRAILEGVGFSLKDCLDIIREMGIAVDEVRASGGGARSALWRRIQADIFGLPVHTVNSAEGPALGAALLAGVGTGVYPSVPAACAAAVRTEPAERPDAANTELYSKLHGVYKNLYACLREQFRRTADILAETDRQG